MNTKMKFSKKILSILLCLAMLMSYMPMSALAEGTDGEMAIQLGTKAIKDPVVTQNGSDRYHTPVSYVYFGNNSSTPIKWRVLDADENNTGSDGMFLLSEYLLASEIKFEAAKNRNDRDGQANSNEWQYSDAQQWCSDKLSTYFSTQEQNGMLGVSKSDQAVNDLYKIDWNASSLSDEKLFFLSVQELADYVGNYDCAPGLIAKYGESGKAGVWWLRSPDESYSYRAGAIGRAGYPLTLEVDDALAARPAFNLNLNSVLFTSAADGSAQKAFGAVADYTGSEWKLTLKDNNDFSTGASVAESTVLKIGYEATTLTVNHAALNSFTEAGYTNVTAVLTDASGNILYYGSINSDTSATSSTVTIPVGLTTGAYTLSVYGEDWNGEKMTDYATGTPFTTPITVENCKVTWSNGDGDSYEQDVAVGAPITVPTSEIFKETMRKGGYDITGWTSSDEDYNVGDSMPAKDLTFTAQYTPAALSGTVIISGTVKVGEILTATVTGSNNTGELSYQWYRNNGAATSPISGATGSTYSVTTDDVQKRIYCEVASSVQTGSIVSGETSSVPIVHFADGDIVVEDYVGTYDGQYHGITVTAPEGAVIQYSPEEYNPEEGQNVLFYNKWLEKDAGTYMIYYYVAKTGYAPVHGSAKIEIQKAENLWTTVPSISGWTYGETANIPVGIAKFGEVKVVYTGTANDGTIYNGETAPTKAGNYTATFTVEDTGNYSALAVSVNFTIAKADYDMSSAKWDYTDAFKYDGKEHKVKVVGLPTGVTVSSYKGNTATVVGDYTAKVILSYDADNYNAPSVADLNWKVENNWTPSEYTVNGDGWMNHDFTITANDGYKVSLTNTADGEWSDTLTGAVEGENSITFYVKNETTGAISLAKTVSYKLDKNTEATGTTGKVYFDERNGWESFLNTITFGLFYKDEVTVKVDATDKLSGVAKIEYYAADKAMTLEEVKAITTWTAYENGVAVTVEDAKQFVYFVRITDNAGNVTYLSTDGAEYDTTAPAISGIENGKTYYTTQKVTVTDKNIENITLNGEAAAESITLEGNKEASYIIIATDKAGNVTTYTISMKPIADVDTTIDGITGDDVTSDDKETVQDVIGEIDELLKDEDLTDGEKAALEEIKDNAEKLIDKIEEADAADETENIKKVEDVTAENVTPEDKTDLENAKADLEKVLEENGGNYTDEEKKAIEDEIKRIDDALEVIENVENVEELIDKLPENITKDDEAAIKAADDAYNVLTDYEKSLVDDDAKKALDDAKAALAELNKPADSTSPNTGDNGNLWLWFAFLFVSGTGIFAITVYDRKRKAVSK